MRESECADSIVKGGPEALLDHLMKSGYPWHALGQRLKTIDQQFKMVSDDYAAIDDSLRQIRTEADTLNGQYGDVTRALPQTVSAALTDQTTALQNRWLLSAGSMLLGLLGLIVTITSSPQALEFLKGNGAWIGLVLILIGVITTIVTVRRPKK